MLFVATLTGIKRSAKGVYSSPEDVALRNKGKIKFDDPDVERVRRAHRNDLENIPAFWVLGALYASTAPAVAWATLLFRAYAAGRVLHTLVYAVKPLPQPARGLAYMVPYVIMCSKCTDVSMTGSRLESRARIKIENGTNIEMECETKIRERNRVRNRERGSDRYHDQSADVQDEEIHFTSTRAVSWAESNNHESMWHDNRIAATQSRKQPYVTGSRFADGP
ncbi:Microsomal glutathione S-transferase 1 [Eumeta japonica]|uniref:Microsomal glutathione S-transferase 1 n=1 Tax=Eumeta variegata TaxID=151549 RepID=A0A4C1YUF9_EUMVA|nr:Microsomal glutathione S-transferase 1 [Eumeta japonica]